MKLFFKRVLFAFLAFVLLTGVFICTQQMSTSADNCFLITASAVSIRLNKSSITLVKGTKYTLKIKGTKENVKWSSSNKEVATVTQKGIVVARSKGVAKIKAKVAGNVYSCRVRVETPKLSKTKLVLVKGTKEVLRVSDTTLPVVWESADTSIAVVSSKGKVSAKNNGTTKVTAKVGGKSYTCKVRVETPALSKTELVLIKGTKETLRLTGTTLPVTWESSDDLIATVSPDGLVAANQSGLATIVATVGKKSYKCLVTVETPKISSTMESIQVGETIVLSVSDTSFVPRWESSDSNIASVDSNGVVTAKKIGNATITASIRGIKLTCQISIRDLDKAEYNESLYSSDGLDIKLQSATKEYIDFCVSNKSDTDIRLCWDYIVIDGICYFDDMKTYYNDIDFEFSVVPKGVTENIRFYVNRKTEKINSMSGQFYTCEAPSGNCICLQYFNYNNSDTVSFYNRNTVQKYSVEVLSNEYITISIVGAVEDGLLLSVKNKTGEDYSLHYERMSINGNRLDDDSDFNIDHIAKDSTALLVLQTSEDCTNIKSLSGTFTLTQFPSGIIVDYPYFSVDNL